MFYNLNSALYMHIMVRLMADVYELYDAITYIFTEHVH